MTAIAGLIHDIGHYPFAHQINEVNIAGFPTHEILTYDAVISEIAEETRKLFDFDKEEFCNFVRYCLQNRLTEKERKKLKESNPPKTWSGLRKVIDGACDADKFDYLRRDALHCGVPYMNSFDDERFLNSLTVISSEDPPEFLLAVREKGLVSAEMFSVGRYYMYLSVYFNHTIRMFDRVVQEMAISCAKNRQDREAVFNEIKYCSDEEFLEGLMEKTDCESIKDAAMNKLRYRRLLVVSADGKSSTEKLFQKIAPMTLIQRRVLEKDLTKWLNKRHGAEYNKGQILLDLPKTKEISDILIVDRHNVPIKKERNFILGLNSKFTLMSGKIRIFASHRPDNWNEESEQELKEELLNLVD